jgi:hypothetical protein
MNKNKLTIKKLSQKEHDKLMNDPTIIKAMISGKAKIEIVD